MLFLLSYGFSGDVEREHMGPAPRVPEARPGLLVSGPLRKRAGSGGGKALGLAVRRGI